MVTFAWTRKALLSVMMIVAVVASATLGAAPAVASKTSTVIALSPASGPVGTSVVVTGTGFAKKAGGVLSAGDTRGTFTTSASGYFSARIVIPQTANATVTIRATVGAIVATKPFTITYSAVAMTSGAAVTTSAAAPSTTVPAVSSARLRFGVSTPGGARANSELDAVAVLAGESPSIVLSYYDFGQQPPIADLDSVAARGATSLITWEPWRWGGGVNQLAYTNAGIAAGDHDAYLRQWGTALASWGKPVMLRYAHEMNGNWYPWADGVNGNPSGSYMAAWRHVHDVLEGQGATNVQWVWSPNVPYVGSTALSGLYPGPTYVDVVALDGYNWGTAASWSSWTSPAGLFNKGLAQLRSLAIGKPILIAETGSAEAGGSKASWNTDLVAQLSSQSDVMGFVWFNHNKETDWRINSSSSSANALALALARRR
jgi:beta-mannanase